MKQINSLSVTVYTPSSQMRRPWQLIGSMWRDLKASRELAWQLFTRDISAQYRQSLLGIAWVFAPPIVTSIVFIILQSRNLVRLGDTDIPYPAYVLVGTMLWQLFADSISMPLKSVTLAKPLLAKVSFPREALILSALYLVLFNGLIRGIVLAIALVWFQLMPGWGMLLAPFVIMMLVLLGISVGLLLTPLGLLYTDISSGLLIFLQLLFFATPVVYQVPATLPFSLITMINPVSPLLLAARDLITKGTVTDVTPLLLVSGATLPLLLVAWMLYRVTLPIVIERLSA
jgi:lipopolysaccharide transport system permease protein